MKIPYGISNFDQIRSEGFFYADKTTFLPVLESGYRHMVFLRPRRFGKSTLVSMLEHYYDLGKRDRWDALFQGLWVHQHPTGEQSSYLVLPLDFSRVATDAGEDVLRRTFVEAVRGQAHRFLLRYRDHVPALGDLSVRLDRLEDAEALIGAVLDVVAATPHRIYLLVDEYDHFANRLLAAGDGAAYEAIVKKGFVRTFYATLKSGTTSGAVGRMFITGVSPLMLDDLSSGFNIAGHASLSPRLNTLAGFTRADTERAVDEFLAARPRLAADPALGDRGALLDVLEEHYNGYRFAEDAKERVFNSDMVLYFLRELDDRGRPPSNMLDLNVRTEYGHLQRIGALGGSRLAERRSLLQTIVSEGHIRSDIIDRFGFASLTSNMHFLSLLYFLGMLTLRASPRDVVGYDLEIPNRVIRELQWEHLALMLQEEAMVTINVDDLRVALGAMAVEGEIAPFLDLFHKQVIQAFSNRDTRGLDEKTIKLLLMTYASLGRAFYPLSEKEFAQGYGDLFLGASRDVAGAKFSWLIELKYLKTGAKPARIEAAFAEAEAQVGRYASDRALLPMLLGDRALKAGMLVFVGAKRVLFRPWDGPAKGAPAKRGKKRAKPDGKPRA
jgi:Predicted AAA-ATPase/PD-(D/E)XK nuclease superfamily